MGEKKGRRETIDRMVKQMVKNGFDQRYAKQKAIQCAVKADKQNTKKG